MRYPLFAVLLFTSQFLIAQVKDSIFELDNNYLEDQLYFSFQKVYLVKKPIDVTDYGFSNSVSVGFIKDIPLNERRNMGFGVGLGYVYSTYKNNIQLTKVNQDVILSIAETGFITNKLNLKSIEIPLELRWRTSTAEKYKFWRIYPGFKFSYLLNATYSFISDEQHYNLKNADILNKWNYGVSVNAGYSSFNLYAFYGLKPLYKQSSIGINQSIKELKVGLIFYIL